ncbi:MAG: triphosphoribosyl-dephospho-CoA synthase [Pirellulales bacterium]
MSANAPKWSIGTCATLACIFEATAPKPGNVYRGADFDDLRYPDLLASAAVIGPVMEKARMRSLGETVLDAILATRQAVSTNTNLGTVLLLAPLAAVPRDVDLHFGVEAILCAADSSDVELVYEAIRVARPGGLGEVAQGDVSRPPELSLAEAMQLAAQRDAVARQYVSGFTDVLDRVVPWLDEASRVGCELGEAIVHVQLRLMSEMPDSLIARKCGPEVAQESADRAATVLASGRPGDSKYLQALGDLDFWLRADGHRRNPGTTADFIAAGLFVALRRRMLQPPFRFELGSSPDRGAVQ